MEFEPTTSRILFADELFRTLVVFHFLLSKKMRDDWFNFNKATNLKLGIFHFHVAVVATKRNLPPLDCVILSHLWKTVDHSLSQGFDDVVNIF